ncbi:restriction endonuclease subunit S [Paucibacter soli]|uniref:restriction endonuclease subunit S n=1 Tax=Paucibacter soli TaxID=3133433 RepID=UPI0030AE46C4
MSKPVGWEVTTFGSLNLFETKTIDPASYPDEPFELYSVPAFPARKPERVLGSTVGSTKQLVAPGDVLVCKINPRINRVWHVGPSCGERQVASSEWIGFSAPGHDARYFQRYFASPAFRELICADVTGVGGSLTRAQPKRVAEFPVPVAPATEQRRIADKLDTVLSRVDAVNDRLARVAPLLKRFRQSVLAAATSGRLTEEWRVSRNLADPKMVSLGDVIRVSSGDGLTAKEMRTGSVPVFGGNGINGYHDTGNIAEPKVLIGRVGYYCGSVHLTPPAAWVTDNALIVRFDEQVVSRDFLYYGLRGTDLRQNTASTAQPVISGQKIYPLPFSLPVPADQAEIVRRVELLFAYADRLEARLQAAQTAAQRLTPALLAKAFRGELVPQDPNDEPASELLKRLAASRETAPKAKRGRAAVKT